jgi:hypothetical protein
MIWACQPEPESRNAKEREEAQWGLSDRETKQDFKHKIHSWIHPFDSCTHLSTSITPAA